MVQMYYKILFFIAVLGWGVLPAISYASVKPSFDCTKARTEAEKLVCSDDDLAKLDNELAERYTKIKRYQAFVLPGSYTPAREVWKRWVEKRNNFECEPKTENRKDCLEALYLYGIQWVKNRQLSFYIDTACHFERDPETGKTNYSQRVCDFKLADKAIKDGADINGVIGVDDCPAYMGERNFDQPRNKETFDYVLSKGANVTEYVTNKNCHGGAYVLMTPVEVRKKIIEMNPETVNYVDPLVHRSLLFSDSAKYLSEMITFLCKKGINPNVQDTQGYTALMYWGSGSGRVTTEENLKLIRMFIDCGTDIRLKDNYGKDALAHRLRFLKEEEKAKPLNEEINKLLSY